MDAVKIEVYGGTNAGGGGCSCGCTSCTPADAKAEFEAMKNMLISKYGEEILNLEFIDTANARLTDYPEVEKVIKAGYPFPITVINGSARLAGAISPDSIDQIIIELKNQQ